MATVEEANVDGMRRGLQFIEVVQAAPATPRSSGEFTTVCDPQTPAIVGTSEVRAAMTAWGPGDADEGTDVQGAGGHCCVVPSLNSVGA
jgi:hypothetical protein